MALGQPHTRGAAHWLLASVLLAFPVSLAASTELDGPITVALIPVILIAGVGLLRVGSSYVKGERQAESVVVVGKNRRTVNYLEDLCQQTNPGSRVVGVLDCEKNSIPEPLAETREDCDVLLQELRIPHLGDHEKLAAVLKENPIDEVFITLPIKSLYEEIEYCLKICREAGVPVSLSVNLFELGSIPTNNVSSSQNGHRLDYSSVRFSRWRLAMKRLMDICGSLAGLAIFGIPMAIIAAAVKLSSKGPVFFSQRRAGRNHSPFQMLKFRTMVENAEQLRSSLTQLNEQQGPVFKIKYDPRITSLGR
ncbi:MAG: sugar transferase, partial [Planctomycetota bacterium]